MALSKEQSLKKLVDEKDKKMFISNILNEIPESALLDHFTKFGPIEEIRMNNNHSEKS